MCGIIGYIGSQKISPILLDGLKKLEYRGYDSAGVCVLEKEGLKIIKEKGKIAKLEKNKDFLDIEGKIGIAHTRWATHGEPNEQNAHPHLDCKGQIAIVHNGIIENYSSLRKLLKDEGHKISSDTDSEVLAHLIEKFYQGDLSRAVRQALALVEGAFGLAVIHRSSNEIVVARRGSPLILGVGKGEMFVASDVPAILEHTKRVIYLNDNEMAVLDEKGYRISDLKGRKLNKKIEEIQWTVEQMEKKGFKHFMLKEIFEQPESIANTLRGRIKGDKIKLSIDIDLSKIKRIIITACGTSWHSALIAKYYFESIVGLPVEVDYASEFRYRSPVVGEDDLLIAISQSGETADTLAALREAKRKGAKTLGIINVVGSTIAREVDGGIFLYAGPEIGVASTKAFSSQVVALLLLALYMRQESGRRLDKKIIKGLYNLSADVEETLKYKDKIKRLAGKFVDRQNFLYLGRGLNFPVALEGALKLKEISYIHAEGYPAAEIKHGPIALIDKNMPVVFVATKNSLSQKIMSNIAEVKARNGKIIVIANKNDKEIEALADYIIEVPDSVEELSPIINNIPLQLLAYYIADIKDMDVDKPRNLAKSVTVE